MSSFIRRGKTADTAVQTHNLVFGIHTPDLYTYPTGQAVAAAVIDL